MFDRHFLGTIVTELRVDGDVVFALAENNDCTQDTIMSNHQQLRITVGWYIVYVMSQR